jgi:hypothetical protein
LLLEKLDLVFDGHLALLSVSLRFTKVAGSRRTSSRRNRFRFLPKGKWPFRRNEAVKTSLLPTGSERVAGAATMRRLSLKASRRENPRKRGPIAARALK